MTTRKLALLLLIAIGFTFAAAGYAQDAAAPAAAGTPAATPKAKKAKTPKKAGASKTRDLTTTISATTGVAAPLPMENFKPLFDGKTLDGWIQDNEKNPEVKNWEVKDGVIASTGGPRGTLLTKNDYENYRIIFKVKHNPTVGKGDHQACVLFFCTRDVEGKKPQNAVGGIQFQVPNAGNWDYRADVNKGGGPHFKNLLKGRFNVAEWSQVEILVNAKNGTARMAVAHPVGTKAVEMIDFTDPAAGKKGPFALQIHNDNLHDEYKDIMIEENPASDELLTTK